MVYAWDQMIRQKLCSYYEQSHCHLMPHVAKSFLIPVDNNEDENSNYIKIMSLEEYTKSQVF